MKNQLIILYENILHFFFINKHRYYLSKNKMVNNAIKNKSYLPGKN